jgi:hypothetical protein
MVLFKDHLHRTPRLRRRNERFGDGAGDRVLALTPSSVLCSTDEINDRGFEIVGGVCVSGPMA